MAPQLQHHCCLLSASQTPSTSTTTTTRARTNSPTHDTGRRFGKRARRINCTPILDTARRHFENGNHAQCAATTVRSCCGVRKAACGVNMRVAISVPNLSLALPFIIFTDYEKPTTITARANKAETSLRPMSLSTSTPNLDMRSSCPVCRTLADA